MKTSHATTIKGKDKDSAELPDFPGGLPRPDLARNYGRALESALVTHGFTDVAQGKVTPGLFAPLWSAEAVADPPPCPDGASFGDLAKHRSWTCDVERRKAQNKQIRQQRQTWWRDNNNSLFTLITDSMVRTAPNLRELLREKYHVSDGFYDGCAALKFVEKWLVEAQRDAPQYTFFDKAHGAIDGKLTAGCSEREFNAVARRFLNDVNPFLRAPYVGEQLGEFIINKIMPEAC